MILGCVMLVSEIVALVCGMIVTIVFLWDIRR